MFDAEQPSFQLLRNIYAEQTKKIVVWAGAGLSAPASLPFWAQLKSELHAAAVSKWRSLDDSRKKTAVLKRLDDIARSSDFWQDFSDLREIIGLTTFTELTRSKLTPRPGIPTPAIYQALWRMHIGGMLTLNIDRLAHKAFTEVHNNARVHEFAGKNVGDYLRLLGTSQRFVANLHGTYDSVSSWVFTKKELEGVLSNPAYTHFINNILITNTVVFAGISADDVAAGGFLTRLRKSVGSADIGQHFWITHRTDHKTDRWGEINRVSIIRYNAAGGNHSELEEAINILAQSRPQEITAPPVQSATFTPSASQVAPDPDTLSLQTPEEIRKQLNIHAAKILRESSTDATYAKLAQFRVRYSQAIHNSRYVSLSPPKNVIFGYTIEGTKKIGWGGFGDVYLARSPNNTKVAIKILRQEVDENLQLLGSFRRGVQAMRILSGHSVRGIISYIDAFELPSCVVMEYIDGPNLDVAIQQSSLSLTDKIRIAKEVCEIILAGHALPERVLHRDIRPANIMLRGWYPNAEDDVWSVTILDFDLSWHRDAIEKSVYVGMVPHGYAAPEQLQPLGPVSSRNALVDSFGIGMTLFYVFSESHPPILGTRREDEWIESVRDKVGRRVGRGQWVSFGTRLSRLILRATSFKQEARSACGDILSELMSLSKINEGNIDGLRMEYWADEILARAFGSDGYEWNEAMLEGRRDLGNANDIKVSADELARTVSVQIYWVSTGNQSRKGLGKQLSDALARCVLQLSTAGWKVLGKTAAGQTLSIKAQIDADRLMSKDIALIAKAVAEATPRVER